MRGGGRGEGGGGGRGGERKRGERERVMVKHGIGSVRICSQIETSW